MMSSDRAHHALTLTALLPQGITKNAPSSNCTEPIPGAAASCSHHVVCLHFFMIGMQPDLFWHGLSSARERHVR